MAIQVFTKVTGSGNLSTTIQQLLVEAGFSDVTIASSGIDVSYSSASGVYGCKSFGIYNASTHAGKYTLIKDDSRKALMLLPEFTGDTIENAYAYNIIALVIVNGMMIYFGNAELSKWTNAISGAIKSSTDSSDVILSPLIDVFDHILSPFYVSLNRVIHPINTVVTDGTNSFTSLGNLFYIKNA